MHHPSTIAAIAVICGSSSTALAGTLILEPTSPNLVPAGLEYRFDATRKWPGCFHYDILQRTGWYPAVWHHTSSFVSNDGDYEDNVNRNWKERYCGAALGLYNYVQVVWTDPNDPSHTYQGVLQVDMRGTATTDEVTCTLADPTSPWNAIECEMALVSLPSKGETTIVVHLDGLQ